MKKHEQIGNPGSKFLININLLKIRKTLRNSKNDEYKLDQKPCKNLHSDDSPEKYCKIEQHVCFPL